MEPVGLARGGFHRRLHDRLPTRRWNAQGLVGSLGNLISLDYLME